VSTIAQSLQPYDPPRQPEFDDLQLLNLLLAEENLERPRPAQLRHQDSGPRPLSAAQRRLWFLQEVAPQSPAYNIFSAVRLSGRFDLDAFRSAIDEIIRRHEVLRSCFPATDGRPSMCVRANGRLDIPIDELPAVDEAGRAEQMLRLCEEEAGRPFDLTTGPLLRMRLLRFGAREHVALLTIHHIVADGWSIGVLLDELSLLYRAFIDGQPSPLPELTMQYGDFALLQQHWLESEAAAEQRLWWKKRLAGLTPLQLPLDRPRPLEPSDRGDSHTFNIPPRLAGAIKSLGRREGATPFMTLLAAFLVLLHRYTGQEDVAVGSAVANRDRREVEGLIGCFVNSMVMRCDISGEPTFLTHLQRVRDVTLDALAHQELPFEDVVAAVAPERDGSGNPLFQVMFSLENIPAGELQLPGLASTPIGIESHAAKFDLYLNMCEAADGGIIGGFQFATDLFEPATIARMSSHFVTLIDAIAEDPHRLVATLPLLTPAERCRTLVEWNETARPYPREASIQHLFEAQADRTPDACAVAWGSSRLGYRELNRRANRLARYLRSLGAVDGGLVALHLERSPEMIVAMLGVLKAGCAYVPLDIAYPAERLAWMVRDCSAPVVLTENKWLDHLGDVDARVVALDAVKDALDSLPDQNLLSPCGGGQRAYVLYTSGSTGLPKGVAVPHRAVARLVCNSDFVLLGDADRVAQASSASFDAATFEIWGALLNGAVLIGVERNVTLSPRRLARFLQAERITALFLTTALFNQIARDAPNAFAPVRHVLFGGEAVDPQSVRLVLQAGGPERLLHVYGPTENTTFSTWHLVDAVPAGATTVPIGRAIANSQVYVLDRHLSPVPVGVSGELYVGGDGVALGYLNRPELTPERFVPDPFSTRAEAKLYRSGDLARYCSDGTIAFVGRIDNQVKIRGFRIEPGEIEYALLAHPAVREAVVLAREDRPARRELVAYVAGRPGEELSVRELRAHLAGRLPDYMVPSRYIVLESLPLNQNGKVDRKALPAPAEQLDPSDIIEAPRNPREQHLVSVWQDVLGRQGLGIHDNYFESGGDSITAIQVVSRLRRFGWQLRVADLFRHPTIAALAPCLKQDRGQQDGAGDAEPTDDIPLTAVQRWFFQHHRGALNHFNQAVLIEPSATLDERHLRDALAALLVRHDALRLRFAQIDGSVVQSCAAAGATVALEVVDLRDDTEPAATMQRRADSIQRDLDLEHGPLLKAGLFRLPSADRLLLVIHHLAVDGVSWRILLDELELGYVQAAANQPINLGPGSGSFRSWAQKIQSFAASEVLDPEEAYWSQIENAAVTRLPTAMIEAPLRHADAETVHRTLAAERTTLLLTSAHRAYQTEIMDLLLVALGRTLKRWSGGTAARVALEAHGREPPDATLDLSRTVGWFTSIYPFVLSVPGDDIGEHILGVKEALREVPRKGLGYGILRNVRKSKRHDSPSTPQLSFNYLGQFDVEGERGLFRTSGEPSGRAIEPLLPRVHELDLTGLVAGGRLILSLQFDPRTLARETASSLLEEFEQQLGDVGEHCRQRHGTEDSLSLPASCALSASGGVEDFYSLSPLQEGLLFQSLFDPDAEPYFCQVRLQFTGALDIEAFRQAWFALSRRHVVLRSVFLHEDLPRPIQVVLKENPPDVRFGDLRHLEDGDRAAWLERFCLDDRGRGFDLQRGPLLRVSVFRERDSDYHIIWSYHHLLIDGWCLAILQRDFVEFYDALREGRPPRLPGAAPYRDYIRWLGLQDRNAARQFWRDYLDGYAHLAAVPAFARNPDLPRSLAERTLVLEVEQSARLADFAARTGVTLNAVVLSLWGLLLARYNDCDDVVFGSIVSGRPSELPGVEEIVGLFICAVPVRVIAKSDWPFSQLVRSVQEDALAALPHQHLPLAEIQAGSALGRNLFDHMLIFENYPLRAAGTPQTIGAEFVPVAAHDPTHYDLALTVVPGERIAITFTFNLQVYAPDQLERTAEHLRTAIDSVLRNPEQAVHDIAILPPAERDLLFKRFNATKSDYPRDRSFIDLFEEQAAGKPDAIAVRCGGAELSYGKLNAAANRLAHHLRGLGVRPGVAVGLCVERSVEMILGPLAILKAGGTFVPLGSDYPPDRLAFMAADAGIAVLVTRHALTTLLPDHSAALVLLDTDADAIGAQPDHDPPRRGAPDAIAYVVYTSGSTGQPKGVTVTHASVTNVAFAWRKAYGLDRFPVRLLQMASMSFDVFIGDLVRALTNGGMLVVCRADQQGDPACVYALLVEHRISIFEATPAVVLPLMGYVRQNALSIDFLDILIIGSDLLPARQFRLLHEWFGTRLRLINSYGVSEATIDSCLFETDRPSALDWSANTPIGKPLSNTRLYVLDRLGRPQPLGTQGELYIGGDGVAPGYLNRPELTATRFVTGPSDGGQRLYRTGDLARWLPDGNMEFLGRIDDQLKIRGYRIELGEIEGRLLQCESVRQAAVVASDFGSGTDLAAYVVADARFDVGRTREALKKFLPHYMIPAFFVRLDRLPLSPNGKVDRRVLPDPRAASERSATGYLAPRTATETALAAIWRKVLQMDGIGALDDFFELGGHSLKAMQITAQIHKTFGIRIALRELFARPTISDLAELVDTGTRSDWSHIPPAPQQDHYELSHAQRRLWMLDRMGGGAGNNVPQASIIDAEVHADVLDRAFRTLIERHESLRTAFIVANGEPRQQILAQVPFAVAVFDLRATADAEQQARTIADRDVNLAFDLTAPPLLRASLARLPGQRTMFALTMHHIVGDGWSGNVVFHELLTLYDAYRHGRPNPLEPLRIQYKDFTHWQAARDLRQEETYWVTQLSGMPERLALPYDFAPEHDRNFSGGNVSVTLGGEIVAGLRLLAVRRRTTLSNVILALFELMLFHWTRQDDLCIGMSVANRNHPDLENLIGFFVNLLPIRCRINADMDFDDLLRLVSERTQQALEHQEYPFDLMIQQLNPARQANRQPLVNVVYSYQNFTDVHVEPPRAGTAIEPQDDAVGWAAFDYALQSSQFDVLLVVNEEPDTIGLVLEFDGALFLEATMRERLNTMSNYAETVAGMPGQ
jgi:amino acid adenylation domain-containing protein/non-ribosomal peptide synthase protein (TIGR01720 family)